MVQDFNMKRVAKDKAEALAKAEAAKKGTSTETKTVASGGRPSHLSEGEPRKRLSVMLATDLVNQIDVALVGREDIHSRSHFIQLALTEYLSKASE